MPEHIEPVPRVRATVFPALDGSYRISLHRLPQIHLTPAQAQTIAREIHQYAIDAMRADGELMVSEIFRRGYESGIEQGAAVELSAETGRRWQALPAIILRGLRPILTTLERMRCHARRRPCTTHQLHRLQR
jgi:hypothetical protein